MGKDDTAAMLTMGAQRIVRTTDRLLDRLEQQLTTVTEAALECVDLSATAVTLMVTVAACGDAGHVGADDVTRLSERFTGLAVLQQHSLDAIASAATGEFVSDDKVTH